MAHAWVRCIAWRSFFSIKVFADVSDAVQKTMSLRVKGFPSSGLLIVATCIVLSPGVHCQVVSDVRRVRAFMEYILTDASAFVSTPDLLPAAMAVEARLCACLARRARSAWHLPSSLYRTDNGAASHNRGGVVESRLLARTQDRTVD